MKSSNHGFTLLSLNIFGVPFFLSWGRLARLARELERFDSTIICLQEIQQNAYASLLSKRLPTYPHRAIFPHVYAPKGGLGTFSRQPLTRQQFEPYQDRGLRFLITFSDWALFKGVLVVRLQFDDLEVLILNTHLTANYSGDWHRNNPLALSQHQQVQQLSGLLESMPVEALIVLCGDFNFPRSSFLYEDLISRPGLSDPLRDDPRPTYHPFPMVPSKWKVSLDYIFLRLPKNKTIDYRADIVDVQDSTKKGAVQRFLTDHYGLTLKVNW